MKKLIIYSVVLNLVAAAMLLVNSTTADTGLTQVESKYVCMITNKLFADEQIEVDIDGKKYYGCCEMCKGRLEQNIANRKAFDPVSGKEVDKATAVIGAAANNSVYYFESEENLKSFNKSN
ncbi:MAG: hypothetical protein GWO07_12990 [Candidatus Dadabacteria bacterium]|nr:hypothetical protein [Candidatus Dadabacteria bacterium]NIS09645.1 hypothetical protein [Candidatus Dadabacteria bacterium]NIV41123.1 hypothetical protein [Candidatus Dadabacteria bacterium]NIX16116.1 hypothetical protein [Candidatus Dadabacteria bacterium]NIY21666.1 hypothetical protein [Candidatus Dadabacteria bacterium]